MTGAVANGCMSSRLPASSAWDQRILQPTDRPKPRQSSPFHPHTHSCSGDSPLTRGISPLNISALEGGRGLGVELWSQWPGMMNGLSAIGEALVITCSECAVLGKYLVYPTLTMDRTRGLACDTEGEFELSFHAWARATALHVRGPQGQQYGVEFRDANLQTLHKICLTPDSHLDEFVEWVEIHQATRPDSELPWERKPAKEQQEEDESCECIAPEAHLEVAPERLQAWLHAAVQQPMPIRALVGNEGIVQGHCFVPRNLREQGPWLFCSSDEVGLHLDPAKIDRLVLHNIATDETACWALKAYGADGRLSLALIPTAPSHRAAWTQLTASVFPELQNHF